MASNINMNFDQPVAIDTKDLDWVASKLSGVLFGVEY